MKSDQTVIRLAVLIVPLGFLAVEAGIFWLGTGSTCPFDILRGETVLIRRHDIDCHDYQHDRDYSWRRDSEEYSRLIYR
jgi:hypothetical protein